MGKKTSEKADDNLSGFKVGDRVKKEQVLIELDADEPKADVRAKEAALESLRISLAVLQRPGAARNSDG